MKGYKNKIQQTGSVIMLLALLSMTACKQQPNKKQDEMKDEIQKEYTSYGNDVSFMQKYTDIIELTSPSGKGKIALSAALQGRVMTSSSTGTDGRSYGWINRELFASGDTLEHINAFGGEERFWLGPEGGQFSIFFEKGAEFNLEAWQTPRFIDLETYDIKSKGPSKAVFTKTASLTNYSGFTFDLGVEREVSVLSNQDITNELALENLDNVSAIGYQTTNILTNTGDADWQKETGLLSIWLLGMYNPSPETTIVLPFEQGDESELGESVNIYKSFGEIPSERLVIKEEVAYFKGDGQYRSKVGLSPKRAKNVAGSYDSANKILTIVKYNKPEGVTDYVNSLWKLQDEPYAGDTVNSYNDGAPEPGAKPLGPFYELETSSPALALKAGESGTHIQTTCHFEGEESALDAIAQKVLGVSLNEINNVFK
ncbi:DUF6786 family protein [Maribacter sp. 2304DJ31-5]|uniref:DUF6786 family protein n=1 Tax=Maribacter sp. 2304DJ31-5 TaxID=3386273 RepID=UPI0039BC2D25